MCRKKTEEKKAPVQTVSEIEGLDLHIDENIQKVCEVSNETSSSTRNILSILVIGNILCLAAVISTFYINWSDQRIASYNNKLSDFENLREFVVAHPSAKPFNYNLKTITDSITYYTKKAEIKLKNQMDNFQTVKIPILGSAFDIDDLSFIGGISFIALLVMLRFSFRREKNNLKIALDSITKRYAHDANAEDFKEFFNSEKVKDKTADEKKTLLYAINFIRRQHHYNFLSMNEVYSLPDISIHGEELKATIYEKAIAMGIFFFPALIFALILVNDLMTMNKAVEIGRNHTYFSLAFGGAFLLSIFTLCYRCFRKKIDIADLYNDFKNHQYTYRSVAQKAETVIGNDEVVLAAPTQVQAA